ncbi:hypothetical protein [Lysinibacillus sp. TE18511]
MNTAIQRYIDEHGREVVYGYSDEVSIQTHEQLEEWREDKKRRELSVGPNRYYVNCYHEPIAELNDILSVEELGTMMKLIPYMRMHTDGHLYYGTDRMTAQLVAKAIGRKLRQTQTILASLVTHGILFREKVGRSFVYGVNDRYHSMGNVVKGAAFTKLYQTKTRTDITNLTIQSAGVLYKMLPFFNYAHYYLSENPNEIDASKIQHLSHRKFAEMVNVSRNTINEAMRELRRYGFIMSVESYGNQLYRINPDVMFRKKNEYDEYTESVREDFAQLRRNYEQNGELPGIDIDDLPY